MKLTEQIEKGNATPAEKAGGDKNVGDAAQKEQNSGKNDKDRKESVHELNKTRFLVSTSDNLFISGTDGSVPTSTRLGLYHL